MIFIINNTAIVYLSLLSHCYWRIIQKNTAQPWQNHCNSQPFVAYCQVAGRWNSFTKLSHNIHHPRLQKESPCSSNPHFFLINTLQLIRSQDAVRYGSRYGSFHLVSPSFTRTAIHRSLSQFWELHCAACFLPLRQYLPFPPSFHSLLPRTRTPSLFFLVLWDHASLWPPWKAAIIVGCVAVWVGTPQRPPAQEA